MHFPDLSHLMLDSTKWLFFGLSLFYLVSFMKVFILARIQPQILNDTVNKDKPFKNFKLNILRALTTDGNLHFLTFIFLFRYNKEMLPQIGDNKIKKILKVLDGITTFLKPYIVAAIIFCILRLWIGSRLLYEPLTITLGEIQKKLSFLHSLPAIPWIISHKVWIYLGIGITIVALVSVAKSEDIQKRVKKIYNYAIVGSSIALNVSFFSIGISNSVSNANLNFTKLVVEIIQTHNKIYVLASEVVSAKSIDDYINKNESFYINEAKRLRKDFSISDKSSYDTGVINTYFRSETWYLNNLQNDYILDVFNFGDFPPPGGVYSIDPLVPTPKRGSNSASSKVDVVSGLEIDPAIEKLNYPGVKATPAKIIDNYYDQNIKLNNPNINYDAYFTDQNKWNKLEGASILAEVEKIKDKTFESLKTEPTKIKLLLDVFFSFGLEVGIDALFEANLIKEQKLIKKLTTLIIETKFKDCIIRSSVNLIGFVRSKLLGNKLTLTECKIEPDPQEKSEETIIEDNNLYVKQQKELLYSGQKEAIEKEKAMRQNNTLIDKINKIIDGSNLVFEAENEKIPLTDKSKKILREAYKKTRDYSTDVFEYQRILETNLKDLEAQNNEITITNKIRRVMKNIPGMCPKCGLPPLPEIPCIPITY